MGHRRASDLALLWPWHRLVATAWIRSLAWELPHAVGVALEKKKTKKAFSPDPCKSTERQISSKAAGENADLPCLVWSDLMAETREQAT